MTDDTPVTADTPDSQIHSTGVDHITVWGSNEADTVAFYRDLLGMPLVLRQPNLDAPEETHLFFDTGDGRILTFFVNDDRASDPAPVRSSVGAVHHLSFHIAPDRFAETMRALDDAEHSYNVFDRGIFHSIYTRDHNGLLIELATDKYDIPHDRRGEGLAAAHARKEADDADYVAERHVEAALEELGLDAIKHDLPDSPTGRGVDG